MLSLLFFGCVAAIFLLVIAMEGGGLAGRLRHRPAGLLAWITGGNWPAKVGAALVVVGIGALLRYSMVNIDVPAQAKLGAGIVIAAVLAFVSAFVPAAAARRTLSLALGGAALGVAYLTAYSAFALFHYVPSATGLTLLALVSAGAGIYSVTRGAMALAILAMFGAYLAPAFAVEDPGPLVVYGYYAAASAMTLVLVALRGWRPLIHLSFLFTLAGGAFLAWTSQYYDAAHAGVMLPMLLVLVALHVAMPVAERSGEHPSWVDRLDVIYMVALPAVAALLTLSLAQSRADFSMMMLWFGAIWAVAATATLLRARSGVAALSAIAVLFLILAAAAHFRDLPWELLGLTTSVAVLALASWRRPQQTSLHSVAAGFVVLFGCLHVISTLYETPAGALFGNGVFLSRLIGALLLIAAGVLCRRVRQALDTLLLATGILWLFIAVGLELVRWELATVALVINWLFILLAASVWIPGRKLRWADNHPAALTALLALTSWWAAQGAGLMAAGISLGATAVAGLALSARMAHLGLRDPIARSGPMIGTAIAVALWGQAFTPYMESGRLEFMLSLAGFTTLLAMATAYVLTEADDPHTADLATGATICFAGLLAVETLVKISRDPWACLLEACCLAGLVLATFIRASRGSPTTAPVVSLTVGAALVLQAWLVRALAPAGPLNVASIFQLSQPALISLLWAAMGCALTWWSRRKGSRPLWIAGASLLIATVVKMLLLDFGSLGQLTNILAVIAAGVVFLAVGWLAPMPPAASTPAPAQPRREPARMAVMIAIVVGLIDLGSSGRGLLPQAAQLPTWESAPATQEVPATTQLASSEETETEEPAPVVADTLADPAAAAPDIAAVPPAVAVVDTPQETPVAAASIVAPPPPAARPTIRTAPPPQSGYVRPPVVGADGVRNYNDYSYPVPPASRQQRDEPSRPERETTVQRRSPTGEEIEEAVSMLLREGSIVQATRRDIDQYMSSVRGDATAAARLRQYDSVASTAPMHRTYLVRRALRLPAGLHGAHRLVLIVPRGVPYPIGDPGHSEILTYPQD